MRVHVTNLSDRARGDFFSAEFTTIGGGDADCCTEVAEVLARERECIIGGGPAPAYRIVRADH